MTQSEYKAALEKYRAKSKFIRELTYQTLVKETAEEQEERIKHLLMPEHYGKFFDYYFGIGCSTALADARTPRFHIDDYNRLYHDPYIRQIRKKFRGAGKSIQSNVGNLLHLKQNDESFFALIIGMNEKLAKILLSDLQMQLESNERFIKDFGMQISYGDWADGEFETIDRRHYQGLGLNQPFRGLRFGANRPDIAILDDCEDIDRANRPDQVKKYGKKITGDLVKAFHRKRGRLIVNNNYIVKEGILDYMEEKWKDNPHYHDSTTNLATVNITLENYKSVDWEPSFPERDTREDVIRVLESDDYFTSQREDFNNPIDEGKLIKATDIIKVRIAKNQVWDGILDHWDLSYTGLGDYKAGVLLGIKGIKLYVLEVFCQKCEINSAMEVRAQWVKKYLLNGYNALGFFDATAAQQAVYTPIIVQSAEDNDCPNIPIPMHQDGDKHNRIAAGLLNIFFRKLLFWDETLEERCPDFKLFMKLILAFEKGIPTGDDPADTLERAVTLAQQFFGFSKEETNNNAKPKMGKKKKRRL
ncbi:hypothetical protein ACR79N_02210 [Sphingobacterium siyangense]|uniref:hypothetical protein n=1 Tax=Sphingobacterium siyangense TaxID=459529 RepID=UPI003DA502DE